MNDDLRQQLWDLRYELLEPDEAAALKARITSEPAVARLYAEVCLQQDLVADAAAIEVPPIKLTGHKVQPAKTAAAMSGAAEKKAGASQSKTWASVLVGLAALVLVGIFSTAMWLPPEQIGMVTGEKTPTLPAETKPELLRQELPLRKQAEASGKIITEVRGPETVVPGMTNYFVLQANTDKGQPVASRWNVRLLDENGAERFATQAATDADGAANIEIPGRVLRESGTLVVDRYAQSNLAGTMNGAIAGRGAAPKDRDQAAAELRVPVEVAAEDLYAHLEVDRPIARPGETVGFRTVILGEQSHATSELVAAEFELYDPDGNPVPGTHSTDVTHHGVAAADAVLPSNMPDGVYQLAVRSPDGAFAEQRTRLLVQRDGAEAILALNEQDRGDQLAFYNAGGLKDIFEKQLGGQAYEYREGQSADALTRKRLQDETAAKKSTARSVQAGADVYGIAGEGSSRGIAPDLQVKEQEELAPAAALPKPSVTVPADAPPPFAPAPPAPAVAPSEVPANAPLAADAPAKPVVSAPAEPAPAAPAPAALDPPAAPAPGNVAAANQDGDSGSNFGADDIGNATRGSRYAAPAPGFGGGTGGQGAGRGEEAKYFAEAEAGAESRANFRAEGAFDAARAKSNSLRVVADEIDGLVLELPGQELARGTVVVSDASGTAIARADIAKNMEAVSDKKFQSQRVKLPLPPEADGRLHIAVYAQDDDEAVSEAFVERAPHHWANLHFVTKERKYSAGDEVELELTSRSEDGQPLPAVLGVRIVNADLAEFAEQPAEAFADDGETFRRNRRERRADADAEVGDTVIEQQALAKAADPKSESAPARRSADKAGKTQDGAEKAKQAADEDQYVEAQRRYAVLARREDAVPAAFNIQPDAPQPMEAEQDAVGKAKAEALTANRTLARQQTAAMFRQRAVARLLLAAGIIGLIGLGVSCMLRISLRAWAWLPALAASLACLGIGLYRLPEAKRMIAQRQLKERLENTPAANDSRAEVESMQVPQPQVSQPVEVAPPEENAIVREELAKAEKLTEEMKRDGKVDTTALGNLNDQSNGVAYSPAAVPVTLFWNPRLITDADGKAKIRFQLPMQAGRYRVLVDAHADGRLGQAETLIVSESRRSSEAGGAAAAGADAATDVLPASPSAEPATEAKPQE